MGQMIEYKCPNCGGSVEFNSNAQKVKCPYCESEFDIEIFEEIHALEETMDAAPDEPVWDIEAGSEWNGNEENAMRVYSCNTCGGEVIGDANMAATKCPYCDSPIIFTGNLTGTLKPDLIIPFKYDKKQAKQRLADHLKGKALLPSVFKDQNHIDEVKGVYVPFWLFDGTACGTMQFAGTKTRIWVDRDYQYTETSHYKMYRSGDMEFSKIPVDGSTQMPNDLMESIEPFDYAEAVPFKTAYLSGYMADKYDVSADESVKRANQRITNTIEETFRNSVIGFDNIILERKSIELKDSKASYGLLPVWLLCTTWNNEKYLFAMNGQTGKFVGDLPMDKSLYWKSIVKSTAAIGAIMFALINIISFFL